MQSSAESPSGAFPPWFALHGRAGKEVRLLGQFVGRSLLGDAMDQEAFVLFFCYMSHPHPNIKARELLMHYMGFALFLFVRDFSINLREN